MVAHCCQLGGLARDLLLVPIHQPVMNVCTVDVTHIACRRYMQSDLISLEIYKLLEALLLHLRKIGINAVIPVLITWNNIWVIQTHILASIYCHHVSKKMLTLSYHLEEVENKADQHQ